MKEIFDPIDTNKNVVIEFSEFWNWYKLRNVKQEKAKVNNDGSVTTDLIQYFFKWRCIL